MAWTKARTRAPSWATGAAPDHCPWTNEGVVRVPVDRRAALFHGFGPSWTKTLDQCGRVWSIDVGPVMHADGPECRRRG